MVKKKNVMDYFVIPKTRKAGVYAIVNWEDFSCYVGSTQDLKSRAQSHKTALNHGKHVCKPLQKAKDKGKILRFLVLREYKDDIAREDLILSEYCYMLEMVRKSFTLYNTQPYSKHDKNRIESISWSIICDILYNRLFVDRYIEDSLKKEYGIGSGYMRNTKYREFSAKKEITD